MRWYILRTLVVKEALRHIADRGAIFLSLILMAAIMLLSYFGEPEDLTGAKAKGGGPAGGGPKSYFVDYWPDVDTRWMQHLQSYDLPHIPVAIRPVSAVRRNAQGVLMYPEGSMVVQIRAGEEGQRPGTYKILLWHSGKNAGDLKPLTDWFWKETFAYHQKTPLRIDSAAAGALPKPEHVLMEVQPAADDADGKERQRTMYWPGVASGNGSTTAADWWSKETGRLFGPPLDIELEQHAFPGQPEFKSKLASGLVLFAVCFFCVYLLPVMTCEERERGVLLAQALSPASTAEILAAKFLFYPTLGIALGAVLSAIYRPAVLLMPFFWLSMIALAVGYMGIGLTVASMAHSQRRASMGALCYFLTVALFVYICQQNGIPGLAHITLESNAAVMIEAALRGHLNWSHWLHLVITLVLAFGWTIIAARLFRKRGWQ